MFSCSGSCGWFCSLNSSAPLPSGHLPAATCQSLPGGHVCVLRQDPVPHLHAGQSCEQRARSRLSAPRSGAPFTLIGAVRSSIRPQVMTALMDLLQVHQSVMALVHPVRLQRLTIQPVNLLVSIHASLKLYIASDHTPLSFSVFERGPLCTTARQLVHALAMHYAAGALFRAGM